MVRKNTVISFMFALCFYLNVSFADEKPTTKKDDNSGSNEVCFKELGCIQTGKEWFDKRIRPLNPQPLSRHSIRTEFLVFTKNNRDAQGNPRGDFMLLGDKDYNCTKIQESLETKIMIHDFTSSGAAGWMKRFIRAMFQKANWNIIVVDWEGGATPPFSQAASNARVVALEVIAMLKTLETKFSVAMKDVHIIGHGLGAHIAGYVGETIRGLGRITGLDPTGPYFQGMPPCVRLDPTDAIFVDVIHTDATDERRGVYGKQGAMQPLGHVDFYPNGGAGQPGCLPNKTYPSLLKLTRNSLKPGQIYPGCSHKRASKYFTETIANLECPFISFPCDNYSTFVEGKCTSCKGQCSVMGLMADAYRQEDTDVNKKLYLKTGNEPFFCWYPYQVILGLASPPKAKNWVEGIVKATLYQSSSSAEMYLMPNNGTRVMQHGTSVSFLVYHPLKVATPDHVDISWVYYSHLQHTSTICFLGLCNARLYVANVTVVSLGFYPPMNQTTLFCSVTGNFTEINHKKSATFLKCDKNEANKKKQQKQQDKKGGGSVRVRKAADHWYVY